MDMTGEQRIPADRDTVWRALNDVDILRVCIPGCQDLVKESDTEMTAIAVITVGPISARFQGRVTLSDLDPPNGYRITGEGQGGVAGHAKGGAAVRLTEDGEGTVLHYDVSAQIGGRLAQLGGRMIDATARSMSAAFFRKFAEEIRTRQDDPTVAAAQPEAIMHASAPVTVRPTTVPVLADASASGGSLIWAISGLLLGLLLMGLFGMPLLGRGIVNGDNIHIMSILAVALALLQGYLLGLIKHSSACDRQNL